MMANQPSSDTIKNDVVTIFVFCVFVASLVYYVTNTFNGENNANELAAYKHKVKPLTSDELIVSLPQKNGAELVPPMKRSLFKAAQPE